MVESVEGVKPFGRRGRAVVVSSLVIAVLSWGHFFSNLFGDRGVPANVPIGAFAVALVTSMLLFKHLRAPLRGKRAVLGALLVANFLAVSALQLLAVSSIA